uniref:Uncharacterized protein n=1 Tax=Pseudomonas phage Touem01 TaxID=3138548 RepID=A0AAU6W1S0_9VIRU
MIGAPCTYVQRHYGVPACIGRRVIAYGKPGTITSDFGHYVGIVLDDSSKRKPGRYHPTDGIVYGDMADKLPKHPRQTNYDKFCDEDCGYSFEEWLNINKPQYQERACIERMGVEYRMVRYYRGSFYSRYPHRKIHHWQLQEDVEVHGEWVATKPEAKASYKVALYKYLAKERANAKAGIY